MKKSLILHTKKCVIPVYVLTSSCTSTPLRRHLNLKMTDQTVMIEGTQSTTNETTTCLIGHEHVREHEVSLRGSHDRMTCD